MHDDSVHPCFEPQLRLYLISTVSQVKLYTVNVTTLRGIIQRSPKLLECKPLKPDHIQIQHVQ